MKTRWNRVLTGILLATLPACSTLTNRQPDPGHALIDVTPEESDSDRIDATRLVSINGRKVRGTQTMLNPGPNRVRVGFAWPQGGRQEADLCFYAVEGQVYSVQYAAHPPYVNRLQQRTRADEALGKLGNVLAESEGGAGVILLAPVAAGLMGASAITRVSSELREQSKPADYIDLSVVSKDSLEGVVRRVRAYPGGRVDPKPWAAYAQMSPPR